MLTFMLHMKTDKYREGRFHGLLGVFIPNICVA